MELKEFLIVIKRRIGIIIILSILASGAAFILLKDNMKVYNSTAQMSSGIIESGPSLDDKNYQPFILESKYGNLISLMSSPRVVNLVAYRLLLHDLNSATPFHPYSDIKKNNEKQILELTKNGLNNKLDKLETIVTTDSKDRIIEYILEKLDYDYKSLMKDLKVFRVPNTDFIQIEYQSDNPELSAFVVNTLCSEFIRFYRNMINDQATESVEYYSNLVKQKLQELSMAADSLRNFKSNHEIVNVDAQSQAVVDRISNLEAASEDARQQIRALTEANNQIENKLSGKDRPRFREVSQSMTSEVNELKRKIGSLNERFFANGLQNDTLMDSLQILRRQLAEKVGKTISSTPEAKDELVLKKMNNDIELEIAKSNLNSITRDLSRYNGKVSDFVGQEARLTELEGTISVAKDGYLTALDKLSDAKNAFLSSGDELKQIQFGQPAAQAEISIQHAMIVPFTGIVVFTFCIVLIFILAYLDPSIRSPEQFSKITHMNLLGFLNDLQYDQQPGVNIFGMNRKKMKGRKKYTELVNNLRYEIELCKARVFLITSTRSGEGKSSIIISLAHKLSQIGKKVLIIDTNFRNNSLTQRLAAKFLLEKIFDQVDLSTVISSTEVEGIDIIGCEGGSYSPSEVFDMERFRNFISELSQRYHYIFLEGASLEHYSDSKELIHCVDRVINVFSATSVINQPYRNIITYLNNLNGKMMGGVLNKVGNDYFNL